MFRFFRTEIFKTEVFSTGFLKTNTMINSLCTWASAILEGMEVDFGIKKRQQMMSVMAEDSYDIPSRLNKRFAAENARKPTSF